MPTTQRSRPSKSLVADGLMVTALAGLNLTLVLTFDPPLPHQGRAAALAILHVIPLMFRRRHPISALLAMLATGALFVSLGYPAPGLGVAMFVMIYVIGQQFEPRRSLVLLGVTIAAMSWIAWRGGMSLATVAGNLPGILVVWALGDWHRRSRNSVASERERAELLQRNQDQLAERAVAQERLRIARELHDVVAHAMSVVAVQAGAARLTAQNNPEDAVAALGVIETVSREAMGEMRRMLTMLRENDDNSESLGPSPGLADLDSLVAATVAAGISVEVERAGSATDLPAGMDLAAFRVVQEALTNVRKHSGANHAWVRVEHDSDLLTVEVVDDGTGRGLPTTGGHGIIGMKERAALYGGNLDAGPREGGGFSVTLRLPSGMVKT